MPVRTFVLGLRNYQLLLRLDGVGRMVAMGIIARLPIGMLALSLVLLVRSLGGTYGEAGFASAANSVAAALAAPIAGRLVDRYSPHRVLMACGIIHPCTLGVLLLLAWLDAPMWAIIVAAFVTGATFPPVGPTIRSIWPRVLPDPAMLSSAFALEATVQELIFVSGPLLVGVVVALFSAGAAIVAAAAFSCFGVISLALSPAVRSLPPAHSTEHHESRHPLAALRPLGVRLVIAMSVCMGIAFGAVEVALPAFAEEHGGRSLAAFSLSAWSAGSLLGGLLAAGLGPDNGVRRVRKLSLAMLVALLLPLAAGSVAQISLVMLLAGLPIAPTFAVTYAIIERNAVPGSQAEVFGWATMAIVTGVALGAAVGGNLITHVGLDASFVLAVAGAGGSALVAASMPGALLAPRAQPVPVGD